MGETVTAGDDPPDALARSTRSGPAAIPDGTTELGIDIVRVDRIAATLARFGARFSTRVLPSGERRYVRDRPETFAGRWAAKEAVSKAFGTGIGKSMGWRDIDVHRKESGEPFLVLEGGAKQLATERGVSATWITLSHTDHHAVAMIVLER
jgi:holo-[acyl-carrier protein] synthase